MAPILFTHNVFYLKFLLLCIFVGIGNVWTKFHSLQTSKICYNIVTPDHMIIKKDRFLTVSPFPGAVHFEAVIGELHIFVCLLFPFLINCALEHVQLPPVICHLFGQKKKKKKACSREGGGKAIQLDCHQRSLCSCLTWRSNRALNSL